MSETHLEQDEPAFAIDWSKYRAVAADLDGVLTRTASIHSRAWKQVFDELLELRRNHDQPFAPFSEKADYPELDGKPRLDGVRTFLTSRGIELSLGNENDGLGDQTVTGIGNRKNEIYNELLKRKSVPVFRPCVRLLRRLRDRGYRLAVVSSSRNCRRVLESADLTDLFDAQVDGNTLREMKLKGKPAPDLFREAATRLDVDPDEAVAIEDAPAGVESASRAGFALVMGVARDGSPDALKQRGADIVIRSFDDIQPDESNRERRPLHHLPGAIESFAEIQHELARRAPAVFLDYDGTLTPIVDRPEEALLPDQTRDILRRLSKTCLLAIVSGRGLEDVRSLVNLPNVWYAGSHGFELIDDEGRDVSPGIGDRFATPLHEAGVMLEGRLADLSGVQVERKKFALAVHYRRASSDAAATAKKIVRRLADEFDRLRLTGGKKILELRPDVNWDKGRAVELVLDRAGLGRRTTMAIYLGDDDTDADAFRSVNDLAGLSIVVGARLEKTVADYRLDDFREVAHFLELLAESMEKRMEAEQ